MMMAAAEDAEAEPFFGSIPHQKVETSLRLSGPGVCDSFFPNRYLVLQWVSEGGRSKAAHVLMIK